MVVRNVKRTAVSLVVAAVLTLGTIGAGALPASADSGCAGGWIGDFFTAITPERAKTFGKEYNVTQGTAWPGISAVCSPNGMPGNQQAAP